MLSSLAPPVACRSPAPPIARRPSLSSSAIAAARRSPPRQSRPPAALLLCRSWPPASPSLSRRRSAPTRRVGSLLPRHSAPVRRVGPPPQPPPISPSITAPDTLAPSEDGRPGVAAPDGLSSGWERGKRERGGKRERKEWA
ncbi:hypothetical protein PR202_ga19868 [Eleusine coracana subsp. coracana]|uniref:Uncharacterized protein n=1 Tax=Eleusine coracana subsp. coracana TaxID=191504 RepID=A0AAV5CWQ5_ELECO|nr:hypothetical protein PR202_ga19868 [Eleusine coracana subsp. coracana]